MTDPKSESRTAIATSDQASPDEPGPDEAGPDEAQAAEPLADEPASTGAHDDGVVTSESREPARAVTPHSNRRDAELFDVAAARDLRQQWQAIQVAFVDEPSGAVEQADQLVDQVLKQLADSFARERGELERAWSGGTEASTEDLRQAIRRYRSFFNRLLAI